MTWHRTNKLFISFFYLRCVNVCAINNTNLLILYWKWPQQRVETFVFNFYQYILLHASHSVGFHALYCDGLFYSEPLYLYCISITLCISFFFADFIKTTILLTKLRHQTLIRGKNSNWYQPLRWKRETSYSAPFDVAACDEEWRRVAAAAAETQRLLPGLATPMRTPSAPLGAPLILSPRISVPTTAASLLNGSGPPGSLLSAGDPHGLIYTPYADYANYAALAASPLLTEYATADHSGGLFARWSFPLPCPPRGTRETEAKTLFSMTRE